MKTNISIRRISLAIFACLSATLAMAQLSPIDALEKLKEGNQRFVTQHMLHNHQDQPTVQTLISGQKPFAVIVSCSDSRTTNSVIFDQGLGDLFTINTAGNVIGDFDEGSIEYAAEHLGTTLIVVVGHTSCGAVKAFLDNSSSHSNHDAEHELGHIQTILDYMANQAEMQEALQSGDQDIYKLAILANVKHGVSQLRNSEPILAKMYKEGTINIIGAIYNIETGIVEFLDL